MHTEVRDAGMFILYLLLSRRKSEPPTNRCRPPTLPPSLYTYMYFDTYTTYEFNVGHGRPCLEGDLHHLSPKEGRSLSEASHRNVGRPLARSSSPDHRPQSKVNSENRLKIKILYLSFLRFCAVKSAGVASPIFRFDFDTRTY